MKTASHAGAVGPKANFLGGIGTRYKSQNNLYPGNINTTRDANIIARSVNRIDDKEILS